MFSRKKIIPLASPSNSSFFLSKIDQNYTAPTDMDLRLMEAVKRRDLKTAQTILEQETININAVFEFGDKLIISAIYTRMVDMVALILSYKPTLEFGNNCKSALMHAVDCGFYNIAEILLIAGADVNFEYNILDNPYLPIILGRTSFHSAAGNGNVEMMKLLVRYGAHYNAIKIQKSNPSYSEGFNAIAFTLFSPKSSLNSAALKIADRFGLRPNYNSNGNETALDIVRRIGNREAETYLIEIDAESASNSYFSGLRSMLTISK